MNARIDQLGGAQSLVRNLLQAMLELGLAVISTLVFYNMFIAEISVGRSPTRDLVLAGTNLLTAVLAMNGLAKMELVLHPIDDKGIKPLEDIALLKPFVWLIRKMMHFIHWVADEAEIAGIAVGVLMSIPLLWHRGVLQGMDHHDQHHLLAMAATLIGIMSMANILVNHMTPVLGLIEKVSRALLGDRVGTYVGMRLAIALGALLSSFTGEPAAAVFKLSYFKNRIKPGYETDAAVGFAMTIGSGGGLTFFAAPPILIIWSTYLAGKLGWDLSTLFTLVGGGCILYVTAATSALAQYIQAPKDTSDLQVPSLFDWIAMTPMVLIIVPHVLFYKDLSNWVIGIDLAIGALSTVIAHSRFKDASHEDRFAAMWQPWILGGLLIMLEMIGLVGDPLIMAMGNAIPQSLPVPVIGLALFTMTAWVSHFADNALASRVFIMIPVAFLATMGATVANFLAVCVVTGALFGSLLTVSANLPNFYIKRMLSVDPGDWFKSGVRHYWTGGAYLAWLGFAWFVLV